MANRIEFAVSCTPIVSVSASENIAVDTIAKDMQKSLGGSGAVTSGETTPSVTVDYTTTIGYSSNVVAYMNVSSVSWQDINTSQVDFICIRHTGKRYSSATVLSETASTDKVLIGVFDNVTANTFTFSCLAAGEAIVLPVRGTLDSSGKIQVSLHTDNGDVAIEYFATT